MIHHLTLAATNLERSTAFYDATLITLGYRRVLTHPNVIGYGLIDNWDVFALRLRDKDQVLTGDGFHLAFAAKSHAAVDEFYRAAMANGGTDNGGSGFHPEYGPNYYAAFVFDPDGYRIEAVV